jgi:hypothetical protein
MANIPDEGIQIRSGNIFPDMENIPYKDKQKAKYAIQVHKAIYTKFTENSCEIPYSSGDRIYGEKIDTLRIISQGKNSAEQYKDIFAGNELPSLNLMNDLDTSLIANSGSGRKGWMGSYWDILTPIANMKQRCKGEFLKNDVDVKTFCTDVDATAKETFRMNLEWVKSNKKTRGITNMLRATAGLPQQEESITDSYEALKEIKDEGGFKDRYMIGADQIISHTEDVSDWKLYLKEENFDDLFDIGVSFNVLDYDYSDCKVIWKYIDPKDIILQRTERKDGKDSHIFGWFEYVSLNKIREIQDKITNGEKYGLDKDDFDSIASKYKNYSGNDSARYYTNKYSIEDEIDIKVCVMRLRWIDVEKEKETEYTNKGRTTRISYKEGHEKNKSYKVIQTRVLKRYDSTWLVGTDFVWDFGTAKNQAYVNGKPTLGYAMFSLKEKSYIERLVPIAHSFAIHWLKFVSYSTKLQKSFLAVNYDRMAQYGDGDKKYQMDMAIKMLRQNLIYFYRDEAGLQPGGGDNVPVKVIKGIEMDTMMAELNVMEYLLKLAEYITGLSPMSYGATPDKNLPVRTALASMNSSNVALSYIMNAVMVMKTNLAEQTVPMVSNLLEVEDKSYKYYSKVIGQDDVDAVKEHRESLSALGIKMYPRPTDEMKDRLSTKLEIITQQGLLDPITSMKLEYQLYHGSNFMEVLHKIDYKVRQEQERQFKEKQALIDRQSQGNAQAAQVQAESEQKIQAVKMQTDNNLQMKKAQTEALNSEINSVNKLKEIALQDKLNKGEDVKEFLAELEIIKDSMKQRLMQPENA